MQIRESCNGNYWKFLLCVLFALERYVPRMLPLAKHGLFIFYLLVILWN
jgi:hypothetical protein